MRREGAERIQVAGEVDVAGRVLRDIGDVKAAGILLPQGTAIRLLPEHVTAGIEMPYRQFLGAVDGLEDVEVADQQQGAILQLEASIAVAAMVGRKAETRERSCPEDAPLRGLLHEIRVLIIGRVQCPTKAGCENVAVPGKGDEVR